jgi:hypothetical protein
LGRGDWAAQVIGGGWMLAFQHVDPPRDFYSTAATVIVTIYIAVAIELRLLHPHPDAKLPEDPKERRQMLTGLVAVLAYPVASILGFWAAIVALYQGRSETLGVLTLIGIAATAVVFFMTSLNVFFKLLGEPIPEAWRRRLKLGIGFALLIGGVLLLILA